MQSADREARWRAKMMGAKSPRTDGDQAACFLIISVPTIQPLSCA